MMHYLNMNVSEKICLFSTLKGNFLYYDTLTILVLNMGSFSKYVNDIVSDDRLINTDIIAFTDIQIISPDSTCKIGKTLNFFKINFNNDGNKYSSLVYGCINNIAILDKFDASEVCFFSF